MTAIGHGLRRITASVDRVWLVTVVLLAGLALVDTDQAQTSAEFTLRALLNIAPWLLASVLIAAYAAASGADNLIARAFQGRMTVMVLAAALMGALSPFCSCGVIPLIAALLAMGVPLAPVMAFWLASPVMDPAMFALTTGTLGFDFAVAKTIAAIGLGLYGGAVTAWVVQAGLLSRPLREGIGSGGCGGAVIRNPTPPVWRFWHQADRRAKFGREARRSTLFLGKWLTLAFLLESLMLAFVPADGVAALVGGDGLMPILIATLVGVPAYLNGYAALPLVSGLLEQGMSGGAAMAFMVAGGVSSIPAAIAVWALVRRVVFALYMTFALTGSLAAGLIFEALT
jgi:uncharacterized membrane protein YraQ (UPF0718 family)